MFCELLIMNNIKEHWNWDTVKIKMLREQERERAQLLFQSSPRCWWEEKHHRLSILSLSFALHNSPSLAQHHKHQHTHTVHTSVCGSSDCIGGWGISAVGLVKSLGKWCVPPHDASTPLFLHSPACTLFPFIPDLCLCETWSPDSDHFWEMTMHWDCRAALEGLNNHLDSNMRAFICQWFMGSCECVILTWILNYS